jgi:hypothetical protein
MNEDRTCASSGTNLTQACSRPVRGDLPAADRLADIRARIAELREQESLPRSGFVNGTLPIEGNDYTVVIERKSVERVDLASMRQHIEERIWRPFLIRGETLYVTLRRKREASTNRKSRTAIASTASKVAKAEYLAERSREES